MKTKLPPYGKAVPDAGKNDAIIILTGSNAFERVAKAKNFSWLSSIPHKLVLPLGDDPESYRWPVNDYLVWIIQAGQPESTEIIEQLAKACLKHGAARVIFEHDGSLERIFSSVEAMEAANG